jgi:hypothetical protein
LSLNESMDETVVAPHRLVHTERSLAGKPQGFARSGLRSQWIESILVHEISPISDDERIAVRSG